MMNANKIRGLIVEKQLSGKKVAEAIGIAPSTFYRKLKSSNFVLWEAEKLLQILGVPKEKPQNFSSPTARTGTGAGLRAVK